MSATFPVVKGALKKSKHYTWNTADSLGRGASAIVYLGRQKETGRVVAVKSFHKHLAASSRHADLRELELLRHLNHVNIIKLLDIQYEMESRQPVLIMEYCEGSSLHHMLEQPKYFYGLPEQEYLLVLGHVANGMVYLRQENVIHRDIKPGNIMRFITDEGESIYKLTDFGAARNLEEGERFESLYGTEEYLHPEVYEKAVLRHRTNNSFDAKVDLWSLGVTFYHAATGKLPFQPYGGRSNKELMFKIISQKESGVISGIQKTENGAIEWRRELPDSSPLSNGLRSLVTPLLSGLMEQDESKMISYDAFFRIVSSLTHKTAISIFHFSCCQEIIIYINNDSIYSDLQDTLASQLDIAASSQILVVYGKQMDEVINPQMPICEYPVEILKDEIFLFQCSPSEEYRLKDPEMFPFPNVQTYSGMDVDSRNANMCCAIGELLNRYAKETTRRQELILKGQNCLRLYVESRQAMNQSKLDLTQRLMLEFELHLDTFYGLVKKLKTALEIYRVNAKDRESLDNMIRENVVHPVFEKAQERLAEIHRYWTSLTTKMSSIKLSSSKLTCQCKKNKCCQKVDHHFAIICSIQSRFRRDKNVRTQMTAHDESIHHYERQKLYKHCMSLKAILDSHCLIQQSRLYHEALKISESLIRCLNNVNKVEINMGRVLNCQKLLSDKIVKMHQSCKDMLAEGSSGFGSGSMETSGTRSSVVSSLSEQARSLEYKLRDLMSELDENTSFLMSQEKSASLSTGMGAATSATNVLSSFATDNLSQALMGPDS